MILADWGSQAPASGVTYAPAAPSDSVTTSEAQTQIGTTDTAWYQSVSYGQFAGWKAQATGWFAIATPPLDSDGCGNAFRATIQSEANGAAQAAGYNPSGYDVVMYYFSNVPCGWAGWTIGSNIWINGAMGTTGVTVHELGHTLGLGHAHSYPCYDNSVTLAASAFGDPNAPCPAANQLPEEYGDPYDVMGQAYNGGPASAGSFTAMQSDYLGWMGSRETTATGPSRYTIAPLEEQSAALHAVKVVDGSETFWVEYRQAIGVDAWLSGYPQATAGVRILLQGPDDEGFAAPGSYLLDTTPDTTGNFYDAALPIGATFRDPLGTLAITLVSADASGATISIQGKRATTVAVSCSPNAVAPGDVSNCTAAVADDSPGTQSAPTGTVTAATSGAGTFPSGASCILSATSTSAATCSMTYSSLTPGADMITASYDGDGTHATSVGYTTVGVAVPASTRGCRIEGEGAITAGNGDRARFGLTADAHGPREHPWLDGALSYRDRGPAQPIKVSVNRLDAITCSSDRRDASIFAHATLSRNETVFMRVDVTAGEERGSGASYRIRLSNGYDSEHQPLTNGEIQIETHDRQRRSPERSSRTQTS